MRLIDADALRDKLQEEIDKAIPPFDDVIGSIRCGVRLARNIVEDEPTIDAVPVVRCKDCKYYRDGDCWHERENDRWIYYQSVINEPNPDDYCSLAERKKE